MGRWTIESEQKALDEHECLLEKLSDIDRQMQRWNDRAGNEEEKEEEEDGKFFSSALHISRITENAGRQETIFLIDELKTGRERERVKGKEVLSGICIISLIDASVHETKIMSAECVGWIPMQTKVSILRSMS